MPGRWTTSSMARSKLLPVAPATARGPRQPFAGWHCCGSLCWSTAVLLCDVVH